MNKMKLALMATAIVAALCSAYVTKPTKQDCTGQPQYFYNGSSYTIVGTRGVNYDCSQNITVCTYYKPDPFNHPNSYAACQSGDYIFIMADGNRATAPKKGK